MNNQRESLHHRLQDLKEEGDQLRTAPAATVRSRSLAAGTGKRRRPLVLVGLAVTAAIGAVAVALVRDNRASAAP